MYTKKKAQSFFLTSRFGYKLYLSRRATDWRVTKLRRPVGLHKIFKFLVINRQFLRLFLGGVSDSYLRKFFKLSLNKAKSRTYTQGLFLSLDLTLSLLLFKSRLLGSLSQYRHLVKQGCIYLNGIKVLPLSTKQTRPFDVVGLQAPSHSFFNFFLFNSYLLNVFFRLLFLRRSVMKSFASLLMFKALLYKRFAFILCVKGCIFLFSIMYWFLFFYSKAISSFLYMKYLIFIKFIYFDIFFHIDYALFVYGLACLPMYREIVPKKNYIFFSLLLLLV